MKATTKTRLWFVASIVLVSLGVLVQLAFGAAFVYAIYLIITKLG